MGGKVEYPGKQLRKQWPSEGECLLLHLVEQIFECLFLNKKSSNAWFNILFRKSSNAWFFISLNKSMIIILEYPNICPILWNAWYYISFNNSLNINIFENPNVCPFLLRNQWGGEGFSDWYISPSRFWWEISSDATFLSLSPLLWLQNTCLLLIYHRWWRNEKHWHF